MNLIWGLFWRILKLLMVSWCCSMKMQKCSSEFFSLRNQNFGCFRLFQPGWRPYKVKSVKNQVSQKYMNLVKIEILGHLSPFLAVLAMVLV